MKTSIYIFLSFWTGLLLFSSCDKGSENLPIDKEDKVNEWIYSTMVDNYLWYDEIEDKPKESYDFGADPEDFFNSLLSLKDGKVFQEGQSHTYFSYIEEKREKTKSVSDIEPTYGYEFMIYYVNSSYYYARVLYVLPNSPAAEAGLKRDDWIIGINTKNNIKNPSVFFEGGVTTFSIGETKEGSVLPVDNGATITMPMARIIQNNPFLLDTVYHIGNKTIGYLVYNHFSSEGEGMTTGVYDTQMKTIFANFKAKGVNEFVLDLRFNGGGLVSSAVLLSSLLAPSKALGQIFCKLTYNDKQKYRPEYNEQKFDNKVSSYNLNLSRLYVLTGRYTASASEAVINGLIPYMEKQNVYLIGDQTVGKAVGSNPYEDKSYDWVLHPITLKICNAVDDAEYNQVGFFPDIFINEYVSPMIKLYSLGDSREKLLSIALSDIKGESVGLRSSNQTEESSILIPKYSSIEQRNPGGLIVPLPEE